jgi:hypothetical protein
MSFSLRKSAVHTGPRQSSKKMWKTVLDCQSASSHCLKLSYKNATERETDLQPHPASQIYLPLPAGHFLRAGREMARSFRLLSSLGFSQMVPRHKSHEHTRRLATHWPQPPTRRCRVLWWEGGNTKRCHQPSWGGPFSMCSTVSKDIFLPFHTGFLFEKSWLFSLSPHSIGNQFPVFS